MNNNTLHQIKRVEAARAKKAKLIEDAKGRRDAASRAGNAAEVARLERRIRQLERRHGMTWDAYQRLEHQLREAYKDELSQAHEEIIAATASAIRAAEVIDATHDAINQALHHLQYEVMDDGPCYQTAQGKTRPFHAKDKQLPLLRMDADIMDIVRDALDDYTNHKNRSCEDGTSIFSDCSKGRKSQKRETEKGRKEGSFQNDVRRTKKRSSRKDGSTRRASDRRHTARDHDKSASSD